MKLVTIALTESSYQILILITIFSIEIEAEFFKKTLLMNGLQFLG